MSKIIPGIVAAIAFTSIGLTAVTPIKAFGDELRIGPTQEHRDKDQRDHPSRDRSKQEQQERKEHRLRDQPYQTPPRQRQERPTVPARPRQYLEQPSAPPRPRQPAAPTRPPSATSERHFDRDDRRAPEVRRDRYRYEYEWRDNHYRPVHPNRAPLLRLPPNHHKLHHGGKRYYEYSGRYYMDGPSGFILVGAPIGAVIANLPIGYISISIGGIPYFYFNGVYYRHYHTGGYVIVTAPYPTYVPMDQRIVVQAQALNMRSGPGMDYSILSVLYRGEVLSVLGSTDGWYYVQRDNGDVGWVMSTYTSPAYDTPRG